MFKSLLSLTAVLATVAAASAADLPYRKGPPVYTPPPPVFTWTGFYIGANAGAAFTGNDNDTFNFPLGSIVGSGGTDGVLHTSRSHDDVSFTGGGQVGYNYQFGAGYGVVVGVEGDIQYIDFGRRNLSATSDYTFDARKNTLGVPEVGLAFAPPGARVKINGVRGIDYFATARGRLGYAFDRTLIYATGGAAFADGDTNVGYSVGGGIEYAFTNNVSFKLEGLYVDLNNKHRTTTASYNINTNILTINEGRDKSDFGVARAGINYRF